MGNTCQMSLHKVRGIAELETYRAEKAKKKKKNPDDYVSTHLTSLRGEGRKLFRDLELESLLRFRTFEIEGS